MPSPLEAMAIVAQRLECVQVPFAFLGGSIVPLLVDDPGLMDFRPTDDVDVIVEILGLAHQYALEEKLRVAGFENDISTGAPICRWKIEGWIVDIMPVEGGVFGMNSRWFPEALATAELRQAPGGEKIKVITAPYFLATKLEAFNDRGKADYYSHDLEDIVAVVDGCSSLAEEIACCPPDLCGYLAGKFQSLLQTEDFLDALPGHISPVSGGSKRAPIVLRRLKQIAEL